jgi:hypothetical protein
MGSVETEGGIRFRDATQGDAASVAALHAESWRNHYRGAYADTFLDGDVLDDRVAHWTAQLRTNPAQRTILAIDDTGGLIGFSHMVFSADTHWGTLLDNLHVTFSRKNSGVGSLLIALTAESVLERAPTQGLFLWVLEQNLAAQAFYKARRGEFAELKPVPPPGGNQARLLGAPMAIRVVWPDPSVLLKWR